MTIDFTSTTWEAARKSFILHLRAVRTRMTVYFYQVQLRTLTRWAEKNHIPLHSFGKRNLDAYLVHCSEDGKSQTTPITMSSAPLSSVFQSSAGLTPGCNQNHRRSMFSAHRFNPQPDSRPAATHAPPGRDGAEAFQSSAGLAPGCNSASLVGIAEGPRFNPQPDSRPAATDSARPPE